MNPPSVYLIHTEEKDAGRYKDVADSWERRGDGLTL
jgi:hypothetical protein